MRNLIVVIRQLKEKLPPEVLQRVEELLDTIGSSFTYASPETLGVCWGEFTHVVNELIGPPPLTEEWKIAALAVYMDETPENIRQKYAKV